MAENKTASSRPRGGRNVFRAIAANMAAGAVGRLIGALVPVLIVPVMIHLWGLPVYGEWLLITAIPSYIMLAPDLGLAGAVVNRIPFLVASAREAEAIALYRSAFWVLVFAAAAFVALGAVVAHAVDWKVFGILSLPGDMAAAIVVWSCVQIFIAQQAFLLSCVYKSERRNARYASFGTMEAMLGLAAGLAVLFAGGSPYAYVLATVATKIVLLLALLADSRRLRPDFTVSLEGASIARVRPYFVPGLGQAGLPLVNALQNQGMLLVIGATLGASAAGVFQTARVLSNGVKSVHGIVATAITVELPALLGEGRKDIVGRLLLRKLQVGLLIAITALAVSAVAGEAIYKAWLHGTVPYLPSLVLLLMGSLVPYVLGQPFFGVIVASNEIHPAIPALIVVAVVSLAATTLVAAGTGLIGVAMVVVLWEAAVAYVGWSRAGVFRFRLRSLHKV